MINISLSLFRNRFKINKFKLTVSRVRICYKAGPAVYLRLGRSAGLVSSEHLAASRGNVSRVAVYAIRQVPPSTRTYGHVLALFQASSALLVGEI